MADRSLNPTVEDYHSDESEDHVLESFRRSPNATANVAAKRSHPSDLSDFSKSPTVEKAVNIDLQSDSGYSSHTAATMSSADSAPSAKLSQSPTVVPLPTAGTPKRRPAVKNERKNSSSQNSPRKPLQKSGSVSSRRPRERRATTSTVPTEDCTDPSCTQCGPSRGRRLEPSPLDSGLDISYPPFDQRSQRSDPAPSYTSPQSPTYSRPPGPYRQGSAIIQPAQSTRRRSSSTNPNPRPVSYHAGDPSQSYWLPGIPQASPYPSPPQEHGPPLSMYNNMHPHAAFMMGATPPNSFFPLKHSMQASPPYDGQRPSMSSRNSSNYNARGRPVSGYGPLITHEHGTANMPSARYPSAREPQSARQDRFPTSRVESESSEEESSEEEYERNDRNDRALMPPPKNRPSTQPRPGLRHANTTQVYNSDRRVSQSQTLPERPRERDSRDPRISRISTATPSRTSSISRPTLVQHPKARSAFESAQNAQVLVENSRSRRRQSYQSYDTQYDVEDKRRTNRNSQVYPADAVVALSGTRRRQTDAGSRHRNENVVESKNVRAAMDAEAYQQRTRGSYDPLTEQIHKAAKRASRVPSGPSDAGSSRSKGSDKASRISQSNRTTVTNGGSGEIRLRVDASAPLSLQFNGDMDGRTLQINPTEDGMADIVIGNSTRGTENAYISEKGSVLNRSRIGADDLISERSGRSSHSKRDGERRALRQKREIAYNRRG